MATKRNVQAGADELRSAMDLLDRPLTARSVIASLLLGRHPPRAPVALLVRWCALFGISETSARVALSRMVDRGELAGTDATYELAGRVRARQAEQDRALAPATVAWDGTWLLALVPDGRRDAAARAALRDALRRSRLAPWSSTIWTRPDNLAGDHITAPDRLVIDGQCSWWRGRPDLAADVDVVAAFGLVELHDRGRVLLDRLTSATERLLAQPADAALAAAFVVGAAAAQQLRRDPLLPAELVPPTWPGDALRAAYTEYASAIDAAVRAWTRAASTRR